jgi:hypothetical protein
MTITVKQLISKLKKMDQSAVVVFQDHDQGEGEFNNYVGEVVSAEPELLTREDRPAVVVLRAR